MKRNVITFFVKNVSQFIKMAKFCLGYNLKHAFIAFYGHQPKNLKSIAYLNTYQIYNYNIIVIFKMCEFFFLIKCL